MGQVTGGEECVALGQRGLKGANFDLSFANVFTAD